MDPLWQDIRYALRTLARKPGFTFVAVVTLALGIGANTAIFSVVNAVLLRPLPYPEPERLVQVWNKLESAGLPQLWFSEPEIIDYRQRQQHFEDIAVFTAQGANLTGAGEPQRVTLCFTSAPFFPVLGVNPLLGRTFTPEEDVPGNDRVVVLSHAFWEQQFGGDPSAVGRSVTLNENPYVVIGVMPPGFAFPPEEVQLWTPLAINTAEPDSRGSHYLEAVARIKLSISFEEAQAGISGVARQVATDNRDYYREGRGWGSYLIPLHDSYVGEIRPALLVLLAAVGFVLLIACANLANLLLARATVRQKEIAIRAALGAGRLRIVRQLLTESVLLALAGGAAGLLPAYAGLRVLPALSPEGLPRLGEIQIDPRVLGFTLTLSVLTGLFFGLVPAWHAARTDLQESLKEGGRRSAGSGHHRLRGLLVVAEVALSLVLLVGAGLAMRSFYRLLGVNPGYRTENVLTFRTALPNARYPDLPRVNGFYRDLSARLAALPGVDSVSAIDLLPLSGLYSSGTVSVEAPGAAFVPPPADEHDPVPGIETDYRTVLPGYFETMGMTLQEGRFFMASDDAEAPPVAIIDEAFARHFWGDESPLGQRLTLGGGSEPQWRTIVGVVRHIRHYGLQTEGREQLYLSHPQLPFAARSMHVVLRTSTDSASLFPVVRQLVAALDPELPLYDVDTMEQRLAASVTQPRFNLLLLGLFALVALVMAAVGLYGVMAYSVSQRTHELGVRMALGAQPRDIFRLVVGQGLLLTLAGVALGLLAAFGLTRLMRSLLFGVSATDPLTFTGVAAVLAGVALLACWLPARRATRVDPMLALRYE